MNPDGSFPKGSKLPLKLFNVSSEASVSWTFDGEEISVGDDCYFPLTGSGTLTAIVNYNGGAKDIIERKCFVK